MKDEIFFPVNLYVLVLLSTERKQLAADEHGDQQKSVHKLPGQILYIFLCVLVIVFTFIMFIPVIYYWIYNKIGWSRSH